MGPDFFFGTEEVFCNGTYAPCLQWKGLIVIRINFAWTKTIKCQVTPLIIFWQINLATKPGETYFSSLRLFESNTNIVRMDSVVWDWRLLTCHCRRVLRQESITFIFKLCQQLFQNNHFCTQKLIEGIANEPL